MAKKKSSRLLLWMALAVAAAGAVAILAVYQTVMSPNIETKDGKKCAIYLKDGSTFEDVKKALEETNALKSMSSFEMTAKLKRYGDHVKCGYYEIDNKTSNFDLVRKLASGNQTPVKLTFNNIRTAEDLSGRIANVLELDSLEILNIVKDNEKLSEYGVDTCTVLALFIPNTYEMYWNISAEKLMQRMKKEYDTFWNADRKAKLANTGLKQLEVSTLASIVEEETIKRDEQPIVAGLYLNRYRTGMKLESDPTVKYAMKDFTIKRVLTRMLETDSPYNTYKYAGLPPGPIRIPSISAIDAVLNYKKHNYIFMCAKEDFSGYHNFAITSEEHVANARRYQQKLNELHIMK